MKWSEDRLNEILEQFDSTLEDLIEPPIKWQEITAFISAAVILAEELFPDQGSGKEKLELVMEIWDHYDSKFQLVQNLDDLVDFRQIFGMLIGSVVERFDSAIIRALVERLIIPVLVSTIFPH